MEHLSRTTSQSEDGTISYAQDFAHTLHAGDVVLLNGDLGMGKSVFSRAVIRALCGDQAMEVPSPTFTLVQMYEAPAATIWHFDLYRLSAVEEIYELGWEEALSDGILLVEWPERLGNLMPDHAIEVTLSAVEGHPEQRDIEVKRHG